MVFPQETLVYTQQTTVDCVLKELELRGIKGMENLTPNTLGTSLEHSSLVCYVFSLAIILLVADC